MTRSEAAPELLDSIQMATFAARGFLRLDAVVPEQLNDAFLAQVDHVPAAAVRSIREHYGNVMAGSAIPRVAAGTPLADAYPDDSPLAHILALPKVRGAVQSLVGRAPAFDHHFLHISYPPVFHPDGAAVAQRYHQDSTIDPRRAFDIQLLYFPHSVSADMGGTRFLPGSHLRVVSEAAIARYQNLRGQQHVVCEAGTILILHHGIWHGGGLNQSDRLRYMFKIRLSPRERQQRLWNPADLPPGPRPQRPIFWTSPEDGGETSVEAILTRPEPWFEYDTSRLEFINRIAFWRYLSGDSGYDADYWLSRVENEPT